MKTLFLKLLNIEHIVSSENLKFAYVSLRDTVCILTVDSATRLSMPHNTLIHIRFSQGNCMWINVF